LQCGLLRQYPHSESVKTEFYRDKYALYHQRPGTSASEAARYAAMADWIFAELASFAPSSILDIGCGGGILLDAMRKVRSSLEYAGIDPSIENSALARGRGFSVATGFTPGTKPPKDKYDLVLAANVISHISDPIGFLRSLASMTAPTGRTVMFSHDGVEPGADHLWTDVEFSFCREHLGALGAKAGLELMKSQNIAPAPGQGDKHVLVFKHSSSPAAVPQLSNSEREKLLEGRRRYFKAWQQLADILAKRSREASGPLLNFGASFWSMLLAAYCPEYWKHVEACVVDEGKGPFLGKPLLVTEQLTTSPRPVIVLGINPSSQASLKKRLSSRAEVVTWNDLITR
jgi:SAM-dependent methyltransferase